MKSAVSDLLKLTRPWKDHLIRLIVPAVITAISIIYWAEWAGDGVQRYYELKQGSFIHLTVIPLAVIVASAKPAWTHWHTFYMASFKTDLSNTFGLLRSKSSCLRGMLRIWCMVSSQIRLLLPPPPPSILTHNQE